MSVVQSLTQRWLQNDSSFDGSKCRYSQLICLDRVDIRAGTVKVSLKITVLSDRKHCTFRSRTLSAVPHIIPSLESHFTEEFTLQRCSFSLLYQSL